MPTFTALKKESRNFIYLVLFLFTYGPELKNLEKNYKFDLI